MRVYERKGPALTSEPLHSLNPFPAYLQQGNHIIIPSPLLLQSLQHFAEFIALFPPGKMQQDIWELACMIYDKKEETAWTLQERSNIYNMYTLLGNLCRSMHHVSIELAPLLTPWYLKEQEKTELENDTSPGSQTLS